MQLHTLLVPNYQYSQCYVWSYIPPKRSIHAWCASFSSLVNPVKHMMGGLSSGAVLGSTLVFAEPLRGRLRLPMTFAVVVDFMVV